MFYFYSKTTRPIVSLQCAAVVFVKAYVISTDLEHGLKSLVIATY